MTQAERREHNKEGEEMTKTQRSKMDRIKIANDYNWYAVLWHDGKVSCRHATGLSSILECGAALADYDIAAIEQCGD